MEQTLFTRLKPHLLPLLALSLVTLAVFGRTLGFDFIQNWDDNLYVTQNLDIRGISAANLFRIFTTSYVGNYAPVQMLSYLFDYQVAGLNPAWFHGVNLLLHLANGLLFYLLVFLITRRPLWAWVAAALFLLHPVQVESVAWVSQRKNLLAMLFSLASLLCYRSYRLGEPGARQFPYLGCWVFLLLALLSKSVAVVVPFIFLLYDLCLEQPRRERVDLLEKLPFLAAAALASCGTLLTQSLEKGAGSFDYFNGDLQAKLLTMLPVLTRYLKILFWPSDLNLIYIFRIRHHLDGEVAAGLLLAAALALAGWYLLRRDRSIFFGYGVVFLGLAPVSQIVPLVTLMNDRYLYFPMLGIGWLAGAMVCALQQRFNRARVCAAALPVLLLFPLALLSFQRAAVWLDPVTLWGDVSRKLPGLRDPLATLAESYLDAGHPAQALKTYEQVFALKRGFSEISVEQKALSDTAILYLESGAPEKALPHLNTLAAKYPDYPAGLIAQGKYQRQTGNLSAAEHCYRKALELEPDSVQAALALGGELVERGRVDEARAVYQRSLSHGGESPLLHYGLACLEAPRDPDGALRHLEKALELGYRNAAALAGEARLAPLRQRAGFAALVGRYLPANGMR